MDEFLQGINASIYLKWILMQNNHYSLNIKVDDNDNNTIIISNEIYHMRFLQQDIHAYLRLLMIMILF